MDLNSLITIVTIVFSMLKITRGQKIFEKLAPVQQLWTFCEWDVYDIYADLLPCM